MEKTFTKIIFFLIALNDNRKSLFSKSICGLNSVNLKLYEPYF